MSLPRTRRNGRPEDLGNQIAYLPISGQPPEPQLPGIRREHFLPSTNHEAGDHWALVRSLFPNTLIGQGERRGSFVKPRHYATTVFQSRWLAHLEEVCVLVFDGGADLLSHGALMAGRAQCRGAETEHRAELPFISVAPATRRGSSSSTVPSQVSSSSLSGVCFFVDWLMSEIILGVIKYYQIY